MGTPPLNILSCQFRACLRRKVWNYWWFLKQSCYCEMTLTKFSFGIANKSESNMFQYGKPPPWIFYLVNFVHACAENFETTDDFWSNRVLLWNDVKQILLWDFQQFWIQHVPIWEHPLEYSILSISCMPVQKTTDDFWSNRTPSQHARKNKETWWKIEEKTMKNDEQERTKQEKMMKQSEK